MRRLVPMLVLVMTGLAGCGAPAERGVLYQVSTVTALDEGVYDGHVTIAELQKHGDFGLGTFDGLDGDMVVLNGCVHQVRADGKVYRPGPEARTPFAAVAFFDADRTLSADGAFDLADLEVLLDKAGPAKNVPVAIRATGLFTRVKTGVLAKQEKPYRRPADAGPNRPTFEFSDVRGTLVGFRFPECFKGVHGPGYHLHFLAADGSGGGHVLELETASIQVEMHETPAVLISFPPGESSAEATRR
jgi:acetolactate decarboxylase